MNQPPYVPPKVWVYDQENGGAFAAINRPTAGARFVKPLPRGQHALQLYSLATPNGQKVTMMLEELLELGISAVEYDAWLINIGQGEQFGSEFVAINPNAKIPALLDYAPNGVPTDAAPLRLFESGSMLLYLAEKFSALLSPDLVKRTETLNWLFWQMGSAPFVGGGFGHFYAYAPEKYEYPINRYAMETKRQLHVLDKQLAQHAFVAGDDYTIADMAIWPWYGALALGRLYNAAEFLDVQSYHHLQRWATQIDQRPAAQRAVKVNRNWGEAHEQLPERHSAADFDKLPKA